MDGIQRLRPAGLVSSPAFSHVAIVPPGATTVYVGGQNAVDADGRIVGEGDAAAQASRALDNAEVALAAAGATLADVIQWTVLFVDGVDLAAAYGAIGPRLASPEPPLANCPGTEDAKLDIAAHRRGQYVTATTHRETARLDPTTPGEQPVSPRVIRRPVLAETAIHRA